MLVNVSVTVAQWFSLHSHFLVLEREKKQNLSLTFSCAAVDCGLPSIPEDGILQLVQPKRGKTVYKDQIKFKCSSKYYTLEGDGNSHLAASHF